MKQFTFSDMNRVSGEILEAALIEPVALTKHGKQKLVIMTADAYKALRENAHVSAYSLFDAPQEIHDDLINGLDDILTDGDGNV